MEKQDVIESSTNISTYNVRGNGKNKLFCASCNKSFSKQDYDFHVAYKRNNESSSFIDRALYYKEKHVLVCPSLGCCYSTNETDRIEEHFKDFENHRISYPEKVFVMLRDSVYTNTADLEQSQCGRCMRVFCGDSNLRRHQQGCRGKGMIRCEYCSSRFKSVEDYVVHTTTSHRLKSLQFIRLNVFKPSRLKTRKKYKKANEEDKSQLFHDMKAQKEQIMKAQNGFSEYFHFPASIVTSDDELFVPGITAEMLAIIRYELQTGPAGVSFNLFSELSVSRENETPSTGCFSMFIQTNPSTIYAESNLGEKLFEQVESYSARLANLMSFEGSGIKIEHVLCLKIQVAPLDFVKSGCSGTKLQHSFSRCEQRGLCMIMSDSNNCLSEAVACSLFFKEEKTRCLMNVTSCCMNKCTATEYCTECEKAGKTEFEKKKSKPETWTHYFNPAGLCTPSSISDVHKLEKHNPTWRFNIFEKISDFTRKIYSTNILNKSVEKNIFLLRMNVLNDTGEIVSHWCPIVDLSKFLDKIYFGGSERKSYGKTNACEFCCQSFFPQQHNRTITIEQVHRRSRYGDLVENHNFASHVEQCRCDRLTKTYFPSNDYLTFSKHKSLIEPALSFYADIETAHRPVDGVICNLCRMAFEKTLSERGRKKILDNCISSNHQDFNVTDCQKCFLDYCKKASCIKKVCTLEKHEKMEYKSGSGGTLKYILCRDCHNTCVKLSKCQCSDDLCDKSCYTKNLCTHGGIRTLTTMNPISVGLIGVKNYSPYDPEYKISTSEFRDTYKEGSSRSVFLTKTFEGEDCIKDFYRFLKQEYPTWQSIQNPPELIPAFKAADELRIYNSQTVCGYCKAPFKDGLEKVFDHSHIDGRFRTASCSPCNILVQQDRKINVYFHNLEGFDSHVLLNQYSKLEIEDDEEPFKFEVIPTNSEKVKGFSWGPFRFKDTCLFLKSSLDDNVRILKTTLENKSEKMQLLKSHPLSFKSGKFDEKRYQLLTEKGCLPYEYITDYESLFKQDKFPSWENFSSKLKAKSIKIEDYKKASEIWTEFGCRTLRDFLIIYQISDCLLLADVFSAFKSNCFEEFSIYPDEFWTLPSFSYQAWLFMMRDEPLELIKDKDIRDFIELCKRGGVCATGHSRLVLASACKRHLPNLKLKYESLKFKRRRLDGSFSKEPNNLSDVWSKIDKLMDSEDFKTSLYYLDANNLYGCAQTMKLPYRDFKWITEEERQLLEACFKYKCLLLRKPNMKKMNFEDAFPSNQGFFIECDLSYPKSLHDHHSDLPLLPSKVEMTQERLSTEQSRLHFGHSGAKGYKSTKLIADLCNKEKYVVHSSLLETYVSLGIEVTKIHRAVSFEEKAFMAPWIAKCTSGRTRAVEEKNALKKAFFKLVVNSVFGKTIERAEAQKSYALVSSMEDALKLNSDPRTLKRTLIGEDLALYEMKKKSVCLDKPNYIGLSVLELSKQIMYEYAYKVLKPCFGSRVRFCYTDTDSLIFSLQSKDVEKDFERIAETLDTSARLFRFKDEVSPGVLLGLIALRSKQYSLLIERLNKSTGSCELVVENTGKGVPGVVQGEIDFFHLVDTLIGCNEYIASSVKFTSSKHRLTMDEKKSSVMRNFDDKREMDGVYREYSIGIDIITSDQALGLVNPTVVKVLREMWSDNEGICIAGGFVSFCLGLTKEYGDVDVFVHSSSFPRFARRLSEVDAELHLVPMNRTCQELESEYPSADLTVYQMWKKHEITDVQIIVNMMGWTRYVCERNSGAVDGFLFSRTVIRDFDLQIVKCGLFSEEYYQRRGGKSVIECYLRGDRDVRVVKYWQRLNMGHFSDLQDVISRHNAFS